MGNGKIIRLEDALKDSWDIKPSFKRRIIRYWGEFRENLHPEPGKWFSPEAKCFGWCTFGEFGGNLVAYNATKITELSQNPHLYQIGEYLHDHTNSAGLVGALTLGGVYAVGHVYQEARKHLKDVPWKSLFLSSLSWAARVETICVGIGALMEYAANNYLGTTTTNPLDTTNLLIDLVSVPTAFMLANGGLSIATLKEKDEVERTVAQKNSLPHIARIFGEKGYSVIHNDGLEGNMPVVTVTGKNNYMKVTEEQLPRIHRTDGFNEKEHSLYRIVSPSVRYYKGARRSLIGMLGSLLKKAKIEYKVVKNPFTCNHSQSHSEKPADKTYGHHD